jgi:RNA polymerase sigma-54 factor
MRNHLKPEQAQTVILSLTPELLQSIRILQLSGAELLSFIEKQAAENPMVELDWKHRGMDRKSGVRKKNGGVYPDVLDMVSDSRATLEEHLLSQLRMEGLPADLFRAAAFLAGNLNESGFLEGTLPELAGMLGVSERRMEEALAVIQHLDPPGVGARTLQECLLLQIRKDPGAPRGARETVERYLKAFALGRWDAIRSELQLSEEEMGDVARYIRSLNPRPGQGFAGSHPPVAVPDVIVEYADGNVAITVNDAFLPQIRLNDEYVRFLSGRLSGEERLYLQEKMQQAIALIRSIEKRKQTLLRVIAAILEEQREFLENGFHGLKPLNLSRISEKVQLHESTVSRAIQHKFIQTAHGVFEIKRLFSAPLKSTWGGEVSAQSVKAMIRQIILTEDKSRPLSDQQISSIMSGMGIRVSRRTVAKYRDEMRIPNYSLRSVSTSGKR